MADRNLRLQIILEGLDKLTAPLRQISGASTGARADLAQLGTELKDLEKVQRKVGEFRQLKTGLRDSEAAMHQAQARATALGRDLAQTENPTRKMRQEFEKARRSADQLSDAHRQQQVRLNALRSDLSAAGVSTRDMASEERRLRGEIDRVNDAMRERTTHLERAGRAQRDAQKLQDLGGKATAAGIGMIAAGTATAAPLFIATEQAMTLESAMADVRKVVDFPSPKAFSQMSTDILDMSTRIPMAAEGIAQIVAAAGRANVPRKELLGFAEDAAKMGVAFEMEAADAGETMAKWRTAFGMGQDGVVALADQINALTNAYGGNVGGVTEMVTRIGPLGKVAGVAAPQIASMAQLLSAVGVESEIGATGIKNMMLALTKGEAATKSQNEAFSALGLNAVQVAKDMQRDAGGTILSVMQRLQALPKEAQAGMLTELFGSESVAAIAPMLTSLDQMRTNFAMVGDSSKYAGSMNREFLAATATATTAGATGLAGNALSALNITLGQFLLPTVVAVARNVTSAANTMRDWAAENPRLSKALMIFMALGAGLLFLLGGLALAFGAVSMAAAPLVGILGISIGALFGWMIAIVAAIAAVGTAVYMIYDKWEAITGWFAGLWEGLKKIVSGAFDAFVQSFLTFHPLGLLMRALLPALAYLRSINLGQIGRELINGLIAGITNRLGALKTTVMDAASSVANWFKQKLGIHSPSRVFAELGGFTMAGLEQGIARNTSGPLSRITDLSSQMTRALAVGATAGSMALAPAAAAAAAQAGTTSASAMSAGGDTYNFHMHFGSGDPTDIEDALRRALDKIERERRGRGFGDDGD
ncbi:phage tail tape measure protein [Croceibacterium ferulae]|uniref:phage tail tape measure protein n=1 Tax=Croceibacterium ferulae TaxID=1854641 RepID=UPI000EB57BCD|nr:phage tail tape measure protein [Croceibacterium ferulae]